MISVLVYFEEDRSLLLKSADNILSSLYELQLKTSERKRANSLFGSILQPLVPAETDEKRDQMEVVRTWVTAALAKLCQVLCAEWSSQNTSGNPSLGTY